MSDSSSSYSEWLQQTLSSYTKLNDSDKNATLTALIAASGPSQLYELYNRLPEFVLRDFISSLPAELVTNILKYLDGQHLLVCCQVCSSWNDIINSHTRLWYQLALDAGADVTVVGDSNLSKERDVTNADLNKSELRLQKENIYKRLYLKTLATLKGFSTQTKISIQNEFIDKGDWRFTFVGYFHGHIVTGCDDHTVQVWDIPSGKPLISIATHSVCCLTITKTHLYTASFNANADSWDLCSRQHCQTFCGHTSAVLAVDVTPDEQFLLTGSVDKTAKLWGFKKYSSDLIRTFDDVHEDWVFAVKFLPSDEDNLKFLTCDSTLCSLWLVRRTGEVVSSFRIQSDRPSLFASFYHMPQDPFQMFTCLWEEHRKVSWLSKYTIQHKKCVMERVLHFQISMETVKAYLLGAGLKFAVIMCSISRKDFHVIDIPRKTVVATIVTPDFCMLTRNGSTVTLCDTSWLNGFNFSTMKNTTPVFAASVARNTVILGTWAENSKSDDT
ncbi:unnamed protein product [Candidula unifasciata]|uniref:F-box domain-containing protein n=1 Tax=Candidula unifasciata TaxID=100452 RepID=A0A8S3YRU4_9EUPU|nr:unnamed protein product [Candidula unifasciata]